MQYCIHSGALRTFVRASSYKRVFLAIFTVLFAAGATASTAFARSTPRVAASATASSSSDSVRIDSSSAGTGYLRSGDIIRVKVWRESDLSGDIVVSLDGAAAIPRIGTVQIAMVSPDSVRRLIVNTYSSWLINPAIEVTFLRRLRVFGAVKNPGVYPVESGRTVADVIALAGGITENGSYDAVRLVRSESRSVVRVTRMSTLADLGIQSGDEVFVPEKGWLRKNSATLIGSAITAMAIVTGAVLK